MEAGCGAHDTPIPEDTMTVEPVLGRLSRVLDLRDYWAGEAQDFTPWLAAPENITLIGEAIGLELEVLAQEKNVGPFRADILCRDTLTGHYVLIENQLERTDHTHLGQLLTYAAGLEAVSIVWVARTFTDEHRAALDWLNRITIDTANFFGLEIELWKIGESQVAPKFNVESQPNDWAETVTQQAAAGGTGELTETQQLHLQFWTQFREFMEERGSAVRMNKPSKDHWTNVAVGRSYFTLVVVNGMRDGFTELHLKTLGPDAKANFHALQDQHREEIEGALGELEWRELPDAKESQIRLRRIGDPTDLASWSELNEWLAVQIERWVEVFRPLIKDLKPEMGSGETVSTTA